MAPKIIAIIGIIIDTPAKGRLITAYERPHVIKHVIKTPRSRPASARENIPHTSEVTAKLVRGTFFSVFFGGIFSISGNSRVMFTRSIYSVRPFLGALAARGEL